MKNVLLAAIAVISLASCQKFYLEDEESATQQTKNVQFVIKGITEEYSTRATVASAGCTDLWVWEGTTLLAHQLSTDDDFGTPTISLTYGSHDLTFLASSSKEQGWAVGVWSTSKVVDDYATTMNVTVSGNSSSSRQVQLSRRNCRIKFQTTDNVPTTVSKCHLTVANRKSLNADLTAGSDYTHEATLDISSSHGKTYSVFVNALTASVSDEEDCDVMIEFLSESGTVLYHYERTVKMKSNRVTTLSGAYFSGDANAVSLNVDWDEPLTVEL